VPSCPRKPVSTPCGHSFITQALLDGVSTLEVSKIAGTSLTMIEKHYGHLVHDTARSAWRRFRWFEPILHQTPRNATLRPARAA